jgi:hypothetical protein
MTASTSIIHPQFTPRFFAAVGLCRGFGKCKIFGGWEGVMTVTGRCGWPLHQGIVTFRFQVKITHKLTNNYRNLLRISLLNIMMFDMIK